MPRLSKVSHTPFSVTDAEATARWWNDVMGLVRFDRDAGDDWRAVLVLHEPSGTVIEFQQHDVDRTPVADRGYGSVVTFPRSRRHPARDVLPGEPSLTPRRGRTPSPSAILEDRPSPLRRNS